MNDVFPEVLNFNNIVQAFKDSSFYQVTLVPSDPQISADRATVRCRRTLTFTDVSGKHPPIRHGGIQPAQDRRPVADRFHAVNLH